MNNPGAVHCNFFISNSCIKKRKKKEEKKEIYLLLPLALMCEAVLKLSVKEMLWMHKLF